MSDRAKKKAKQAMVKPAKKAAGPSPFMTQYLKIKAEQDDALLFFRMGDFYELFFDDAAIAAGILDITLTQRGEHEGRPIPMAGVPYHAAEGYLARLIKAGQRVAVCEQVESPAEAKKRGSKAVVKREIVRVVTPGTVTEDAILPARQGQALAAIGIAGGGAQAGLAVCDVSTGRFDVFPIDTDAIGEVLASLPARELLVSEADAERPRVAQAISALDIPVTLRARHEATAKAGERTLKAAYQVSAHDGFAPFSRAELTACGILLNYVSMTQAGGDIKLQPPRRTEAASHLLIDPATRASLEIDRALSGERAGSLLAAIDRTLTAPGARLMADRLRRPSRKLDAINARLDAVAFFASEPDLRDTLRVELKSIPDAERARTRLQLGRGGPRDLAAIGSALTQGERAVAALAKAGLGLPPLLEQAAAKLTLAHVPALGAFANNLTRAITPDPPQFIRDGNFIAPGWDPALDDVRELRDNARRIIAELQARYSNETGINALKIKFNNVLGYFVDVPARHGDAMMKPPLSETFIHRQTLANAVRFSTSELAELAGRISRAEDEAKTREINLFESFVAQLDEVTAPLASACEAMADLDVAAANAAWAIESGGVRPDLTTEPVFEAKSLRHPVVEASRKAEGEGFTANDLRLDGAGTAAPRLLLVTGPNMAGKSTYLRQAMLAVIMAQAGCFVPAAALRLGLADRLFSRVGASDDLAKGRSTFMVEMIETAAILNQATPNSFVILDEVGRGTSTYDGLAIAWAAVEHLHNTNRCRALFATHYHELTALADNLDGAANASLKAREWKNELVFLHEVQPGPTDRSYGVQVARLAGMPARAVKRASDVLKRLEADRTEAESLPLFAAIAEPDEVAIAEVSALASKLYSVDPDTLTPREALDLIYSLKDLAGEP